MSERTALFDPASAAGAVFVEEAGFLVPAHFGDAAAEYRHARSAAVVADVLPHGKLVVRGPDAPRFLHNLTTNDILALRPGGGCEAFLTTVKAKVLACLLIFRQPPADPPTFWLDTAPGAAGRVLTTLDRYLISEQVEFVDRTQELAQLHVAGPRADAVLTAALGADATTLAPLSLVALPGGTEDGWLRRHDALGVSGYDVLCPTAGAAEVWRRLVQAGARPAGHEACEVLRVEAGLPREGTDIDENTFAPEVGRIAQTISYTKGCYLGQESIVMARDRGQVNRTLAGVRLPGGPVAPGSLLFAQGKEVGRVTSSVQSPRLGAGLGLAYLRRGHQQPGTKLEVETAGARAPAEVVALPLDG